MPDRSTTSTKTGSSVSYESPSGGSYTDLSGNDGTPSEYTGAEVANPTSNSLRFIAYAWHTSGSGYTVSDETTAWGFVAPGEVKFIPRPAIKYTHLVLWHADISSDGAAVSKYCR